MNSLAHRWGDNDKYFWRFTYSNAPAKRVEIMLSSGSEDYPGCSLRFQFFGRTFIIALPPIVPLYKEKVTAKFWSETVIKRMGQDWYWDLSPREFGFYINDGFFCLNFGRQTKASATEKSIGWFLPWAQWRFIETRYYDFEGKTVPEKEALKISFTFKDYDEEQIEAQCQVEEREWLFGTNWFSWLSFFRKPKIHRSMDIQFSKEVGPEKGSWKGGILGHGIDLVPEETMEQAFRRYCSQNNLTFIAAN